MLELGGRDTAHVGALSGGERQRVALGRALPAVIAPAIITDLKLAPAWVGVYFGLTAAASLVAQLGCGSFIVRHGAMRMAQPLDGGEAPLVDTTSSTLGPADRLVPLHGI